MGLQGRVATKEYVVNVYVVICCAQYGPFNANQVSLNRSKCNYVIDNLTHIVVIISNIFGVS